jgi:hypothetical protein
LTYLNARGSAVGLQSLLNNLLGTFADEPVTVTSKVFTKDVTGDNTPDVVMDVIHFYPWGNFEGYIYGFGCRNGEYVTLLKHDLCCEYLANRIQIEGLRDIQDMNRNRAPEILYSSMTMVGTHAYYSREFYILEWDGEGFVNLVQSDQEFGGARVDGDGVILDADGDGRLDLLLKNEIAPAYPDGGPQRERTDIWQWNGYVYTLSSWRYPAPVYRIQAVYDGDDSSVFGQYDRALGYYQQAIFKEDLLGWSQGQLWPDTVYEVEGTPTPDPDERPRLEAYARYRILLLHVLQGNMGAAETVYDTLITQFPPGTLGGQYAELATVFWEEYNLSGDMGSSCLMAIEYTAAHLDAILTPLGASFYNQRSYLPEEICPFE